jgi:hypothetical protein
MKRRGGYNRVKSIAVAITKRCKRRRPACLNRPLRPTSRSINKPTDRETLPMKTTAAALFLASLFFTSNAAFAVTTDDVKWINACVKDNKGDAADEVILKYCTCMNEKMDNSENRSITQWEKTHETERKACDKESGWK